MALAKRRMKTVSDINVTPMVDVMLVLLIIFMVITPMLQKGVTVEMARSRNPQKMPDAEKEDAILVFVTKDGSLFFQHPSGVDKVNKPEDLTVKIKDMLVSRVDKTVYIRSDARAKYKDVVDVVDNVRSAGVDNVGLLTEKLDEKAARTQGSGGQ